MLNGIGPKNAQKLKKLGLFTLEDMLYFFPRRYDDYSQLKPINRLWFGDEVTVVGSIKTVSSRKVRSGKMSVIEVIIDDGTGGLRLTWFNQPWMENLFMYWDILLMNRIKIKIWLIILKKSKIDVKIEHENLLAI